MSHKFKVRQTVKLNYPDPRTSASNIYEVVRHMPADQTGSRRTGSNPARLSGRSGRARFGQLAPRIHRDSRNRRRRGGLTLGGREGSLARPAQDEGGPS